MLSVKHWDWPAQLGEHGFCIQHISRPLAEKFSKNLIPLSQRKRAKESSLSVVATYGVLQHPGQPSVGCEEPRKQPDCRASRGFSRISVLPEQIIIQIPQNLKLTIP